MKVAIVGAGAVGLYVGGLIAKVSESPVVLVGRQLRPEISTQPLELRSTQGTTIVPPERFQYLALEAHEEATVAALSSAQLVFVAVKSQATVEVGRMLAEVLAPGALCVSLQNGLQNAELLVGELGRGRVLAGIVDFNVRRLSTSVLQKATDGDLIVESRPHSYTAKLYELFSDAGLSYRASKDIAAEQWTKLLVNLNNAVSALSGAATHDLLANKELRGIIASLIEEGHRVARRCGVRPARLRHVPVGLMPTILRLPSPIVRLVTRAQMRIDPEARSSMWEDLNAGRRTEVDFLNGELVKRAEEAGVDAPRNRRLVELIHEVEREHAENQTKGSPNIAPEALAAALNLAAKH